MPPRLYLETEEYDSQDCETYYGKKCGYEQGGDYCEGCESKYEGLTEDVINDVDEKYKHTHYRVFDIHESEYDALRHKSRFWVELKWFKEP